MSLKKYSVCEFDIVFISYDEPDAETNWAKLKQLAPWAKRVHGVTGFDAAHQAAGEQSNTRRLFTVDGDNLVDPEFFGAEFEADFYGEHKDCVMSWGAKNTVNGLCYGNGGIKLWPREIITNMQSHENSKSIESDVDFCWHLNYWQMADSYSTTNPAGSPKQAFRAGFREGVKMTLDNGKRISRKSFAKLNNKNKERLLMWCCVGADVKNGNWAMYGARLGCVLTVLDDFVIKNIASYEWMDEFWKQQQNKNPNVENALLAERLRQELKMPVAELDSAQSQFAKSIYKNPTRSGMMNKEHPHK